MVPDPGAICAQAAHEIVLDGWALQQLGGAMTIPYPGVPIDEAAKLLGKHKEALRNWLPNRPGRTRGKRAENAKGRTYDDLMVWLQVEPTRQHPLGVRYVPQRVLGRGARGGGMETPVVWSETALDPGASKGRPPSKWWGSLWQSMADNIPAEFEQVVQRVPRVVPYPGKDGQKRDRFRGWWWTVGRAFGIKQGLDIEGLAGQWYPGVMDRWAGRRSLACESCWKLRRTSFAGYQGWNELVSHLSGGLLYGHEVEKPADFEYERKQPYRKRRGARREMAGRPTVDLKNLSTLCKERHHNL